MRNERQWKCRLKRDLCWNCNKPLEKISTHYASKCFQCGTIYSEIVLDAYKKKEGLKTN